MHIRLYVACLYFRVAYVVWRKWTEGNIKAYTVHEDNLKLHTWELIVMFDAVEKLHSIIKKYESINFSSIVILKDYYKKETKFIHLLLYSLLKELL